MFTFYFESSNISQSYERQSLLSPVIIGEEIVLAVGRVF